MRSLLVAAMKVPSGWLERFCPVAGQHRPVPASSNLHRAVSCSAGVPTRCQSTSRLDSTDGPILVGTTNCSQERTHVGGALLRGRARWIGVEGQGCWRVPCRFSGQIDHAVSLGIKDSIPSTVGWCSPFVSFTPSGGSPESILPRVSSPYPLSVMSRKSCMNRKASVWAHGYRWTDPLGRFRDTSRPSRGVTFRQQYANGEVGGGGVSLAETRHDFTAKDRFLAD